MGYADFSLSGALKSFGLASEEGSDLFSAVPEIAPSDWLRSTLDRTVPLALAIHTEIDGPEYYLDRAGKILGILDSLLR